MNSEAKKLLKAFKRLKNMFEKIASEPYEPGNASSRESSPAGIKLYNRQAMVFNQQFPHDEIMIFREDTNPTQVSHPKIQEILGQIESALDVLTGGSIGTSIEVNPIFIRREIRSQSDLCFVLMPFHKELEPIYEDHIKK